MLDIFVQWSSLIRPCIGNIGGSVLHMVCKASPRWWLGVGACWGSKASSSPSQDAYGVRLRRKASAGRPKALFGSPGGWGGYHILVLHGKPRGIDGKGRGAREIEIAEHVYLPNPGATEWEMENRKGRRGRRGQGGVNRRERPAGQASFSFFLYRSIILLPSF